MRESGEWRAGKTAPESPLIVRNGPASIADSTGDIYARAYQPRASTLEDTERMTLRSEFGSEKMENVLNNFSSEEHFYPSRIIVSPLRWKSTYAIIKLKSCINSRNESKVISKDHVLRFYRTTKVRIFLLSHLKIKNPLVSLNLLNHESQ